MSDKTSRDFDWQLSPDQVKHLILDLFSQLYENELDLEQKFIKEQAGKFLDMLKSSKLTKVIGDKQDKFGEYCRKTNEELEAKAKNNNNKGV